MNKDLSSRPTLTKQRLAREVGRRTRVSNKDTLAVIEALITVVSEQLAIGGRVELANFLTLDVQERRTIVSEQIFGHTSSSSTATKSTHFTLRCKPGKQLRAQIATLSHRANKDK